MWRIIGWAVVIVFVLYFLRSITDLSTYIPGYITNRDVIEKINDYQELAKEVPEQIDPVRKQWIEDNITMISRDIYGYVIAEKTGIFPWKSFPLYFDGIGDYLKLPVKFVLSANQSIKEFSDEVSNLLAINNNITFSDRVSWPFEPEQGNFVASSDIPFEAVVYINADKVSHRVDHRNKTITVTIDPKPFYTVKDLRFDASALVYFGVKKYEGIGLQNIKPTLKEDIPEKMKIDARTQFDDYINRVNADMERRYRKQFESFYRAMDERYSEDFPGQNLGYKYIFEWMD